MDTVGKLGNTIRRFESGLRPAWVRTVMWDLWLQLYRVMTKIRFTNRADVRRWAKLL